jgi:hypothetical protein
MASLVIQLPKSTTYHIPAGCFAGRCVDVSQLTKITDHGPVQQIRFWFELEIPSVINSVPMAGCNLDLDLNPGSKLIRFLDVWLGRNFIARNSGSSFYLGSLKGEAVEVVVEHITSRTHDYPFVLVKGVYRPGRLELTEQTLKLAA